MRGQPDDTAPQVHTAMAELLAALPPARRFAMACNLTHATFLWSRRGIREAMPGASEREVLLRWAEVTYGREVADRLRRDGRPLGA